MKKNKNIFKIGMLSLITISTLTIKSNATIQIVPTTADKVVTNVTVNTSFKTSRDLDSLSSTLGTTRLDPHMSTNKDWGAVSYLANSAYGVNAIYDIDAQEGKVGKLVSINGTNYYSSTPNISGVMNWGGNPNRELYTQSAGILNNATELTVSNETVKNNISLLLSNKENKYVDTLNTTDGMAIGETFKWGCWYTGGSDVSHPVSGRCGLFGYAYGFGSFFDCVNGYGNWKRGPADIGAGSKLDTATFRPVIWNIE